MSIPEYGTPDIRKEAERKYGNIEANQKDTLRQEFSSMLEKVDREDLRQTVLWDIQHNAEDISRMLQKLNKYKLKNGESHPLDLCLVLLTAAGADMDGLEIQKKEPDPSEKVTSIEVPFKNELLKIENVWQSVRRSREKVFDEYGNSVQREYLITEFKLSDCIRIDTQDKNLSSREEFLARAMTQYLQMRYQWDSNIFQDKKYQVIKELNDDETKLVDSVFDELDISKKEQYSFEGLSKKNIEKRVVFNKSLFWNKGHSSERRRYSSLDNVVLSLGIGQMLTRDSVVVNGHHGWCGDPEAMMGIVAQTMYKANRALAAQEGRGKYTSVVGITAENLGIVPIPEEKQLHKRFMEKLKRRFGKIQNPNLSEGFFKEFRYAETSERAAFDPETYGRDMEWTANHIFGLLGQKDGEGPKNLWIGWSYGGAGAEEFAARILSRVEDNWMDQAPKLYATLGAEYQRCIDLINDDKSTPDLLKRTAVLYPVLRKLHQVLQDPHLPEFKDWQHVGAPDLIVLPHASAVNDTCDFLGPGRLDAFLKKFGEFSASAGSGFLVGTGTGLHRVRATGLAPVRWALEGIAGVYTKMILYTGTIQPEEREELDRIGKRHKVNYSSPINGQDVVGEQSRGLRLYKGKSEEASRLLRTHQLFVMHAMGYGDFLVNFKKWSNSQANSDTDMLTTVDDFGHSIVAKKEHKERMPIDMYIEASKTQLYAFREKMKQLAGLNIGFSPGRDFINAEETDLFGRFVESNWDLTLRHLDEPTVLARKEIYEDVDKIFINDPQLGLRAMQVLEEHEPHLFMPRPLKPTDNRGALMRLENIRSKIAASLLSVI